MGFKFIFAEWHRGNAKERSLLLLIFAPMLICMLGLIFNFASFIFAFVSRLLGWFLLTAFFGGGGIFCYEKLRENQVFSSFSSSSSSSFSDQTEFTDSSKTESREEGFAQGTRRKRWF
jgi:hypothetical protein